MDTHTKAQRRKNMQAIRCRNTGIENILAKALWQKGYRYRRNYNKIIGKPDIVLVSKKVAIFCDSEFWHGKNWDKQKNNLKSNRKFWLKKIENNIKRDIYVNKILKKTGWKVLRFWGRDIETKTSKCINKIVKELEK